MSNAPYPVEVRPGDPWRWRAEGVVHVLVGAVQVLFPLLTFANSPPGSISWNAGLFMLFFGAVGAALIGIGLRLLRSRPRPSWLVRIALYLPILACLPPMIQVAREAVVKRRVINNLKQLGEALQQYEADYKILPEPPASQEP